MDHAADVGVILVERRVHRHDRRLDRLQVAFEECPIQPDPSNAAWAESMRDGADVKYISSAPGTRRLMLPCPLGVTTPPAVSLAAVSTSG